MAEIISAGVHRPRNVDWQRAAALLYGDWGTSKAYVLGLAFVAAGFASFPIILAVCALTASSPSIISSYALIFPMAAALFCRAAAESIFGLCWGALVDREFYRYRCFERMGRRELISASRRNMRQFAAMAVLRCLEPSTTLVQSIAAASRFGCSARRGCCCGHNRL